MAWVTVRVGKDGAKQFMARYRDPDGRTRSAGTYPTRREAERAGHKAETQMDDGSWLDPKAGKITFHDYVEYVWWPSRHLEVSTRAAYRSYLDVHFLPAFGKRAIAAITPSMVQAWVTIASESGLSPRSIRKYHTLLHGIFARAVRDRAIAFNPCEATELPKVVIRKSRILTPEEFDKVLARIPDRWVPMILVSIETGVRWGELVALRPRHVDFLLGTITVEETIVEVAAKHSPTGERYLVKPYPKDDEPRTLRVSAGLLQVLTRRIEEYGLGPDDLLFPSRPGPGGSPVSRNNFRTKVWLPAIEASGVGFHVRMHDLRHAHASWLLAGGADLLAVMERLGHRQIQTAQQYLHTMPEADEKALKAFQHMRHRTADTDGEGGGA